MSCAINRLPVLFIPHGGGPCFHMNDPDGTWTQMARYLKLFPSLVSATPKALVVISGHWDDTSVVSVTSNPNPGLLFDYYGFPEHTYKLKWPAPGSPVLADRIVKLLKENNIAAKTDDKRNFDHGVFSPLLVSYPEPTIPTVQVSLQSDLDPAFHYKLGEALRPLRDEGVLIIASGFSYHNLRHFFSNSASPTISSKAFDSWLVEATTHPDVSERARRLGTNEFIQAPSLYECHPKLEHIMPLIVAAGAAGDDVGEHIYSEKLMGRLHHSGFWFGERKGDYSRV